jgi:hypothetical protein
MARMISNMGMMRRIISRSFCISSHSLGSSPFAISSSNRRLYSSESSSFPSSPISPNRLSILRDKLKDIPMLSDFAKTDDHSHQHSTSSHQDHIEDHLQSSPGDLFSFERTSNLYMDYTPSPSSSTSLPFNPPPPLSKSRKFFVETYGCQMNFSDTEIVNSIMKKAGYDLVEEVQAADVILINTCAIRENAEQKVWGRLQEVQLLFLPLSLSLSPSTHFSFRF